ncbi:thioesterase family protein [Streptomyces sp. ACA25]|uniref:thioesterase family protein n=1 Tax=Streptomyces sp. ACA25 TaxID=3022596 RepID=UPI0023073BDB|nr:thioesterase family protein [Streptomyces sp. ACA25]MDB1088354.1 thioesterase family protein [Streptomyces sp. ACA25]
MSQAHIGDSEFDRDTTVRTREPGVFEADISQRWSIIGAINGGYLNALLGRALAHTLPHPDPFTVTAHFLTATRPGPAVIRTAVARAGNTLSTGSASLFQADANGDEVERIRFLGTYGDLTALPEDVRTSAKPPVLPPYERCPGMKDAPDGAPVPGDVDLIQRLDSRLDPATAGWALGSPSGNGEMRGWFAFADGRDLDPLGLLMVGDALPPTAFDLGLKGWVPTVELTTHVRARPAPGPLRVAITTRNLAGGFLEEDADIWDSADRLVAQSRQLARAPRG